MTKILKALCLLIYALAFASLFTVLPFATPLRYVAGILLGAHLLEAMVMFRDVRRYPGSPATSLLLTLLFGFLHLWPLRQR
ncbi:MULTISPECIES: hypothetical protein [unclassified Sphingomonas]|mgnify:CR=1 FL=1|uniref:hypothetical protein n=1 Tax=unclassified Sphingomonas TaxID=196159 RepID=UPI00092A3ABC|nr:MULTISPECIES: hypothetical protein [unclassified Sphingomonas]MBN8849713.1 hypothetical protein [Sphingomonas sp.]OJV31616.1 MAG: hypothetical protein BGO24_05420 [Sphingomonas sp. 67-36]